MLCETQPRVQPAYFNFHGLPLNFSLLHLTFTFLIQPMRDFPGQHIPSLPDDYIPILLVLPQYFFALGAALGSVSPDSRWAYYPFINSPAVLACLELACQTSVYFSYGKGPGWLESSGLQLLRHNGDWPESTR